MNAICIDELQPFGNTFMPGRSMTNDEVFTGPGKLDFLRAETYPSRGSEELFERQFCIGFALIEILLDAI
jgi:hypothetical protein